MPLAASIIPAVIGGGAALAAASKTASAAKQASKVTPVDINAVSAQASRQAIENARAAAALERELNPLAPQLREQSLQGVLSQLGDDPYSQQVRETFLQIFQAPTEQSELSRRAQEWALQQLALGGQLDTETANQVIRSSAARAAGVGGGGLGLGRDLSARDLGLTSMQLAQQRALQAAEMGRAADQFALEQANQRFRFGTGVVDIGQQGFNRALSAAQLGQSIAQPVTGLDPSAIANLAVGNVNQQNAANQAAAAIKASGSQGLSQLGGNLLGVGLQGLNTYYGNRPKGP